MENIDEKIANHIIDYIYNNKIVYIEDDLHEIWNVPYNKINLKIITSFTYNLLLSITVKSKISRTIEIHPTKEQIDTIKNKLFEQYRNINDINHKLAEEKRISDLNELFN